ncbi:MAG: MBOAT family O-acyltransferase [Flavobacteriaceae bacterium]
MLFNSLDFAVFLPIVFLCYWFVFKKTIKLQNIWLLVCSYFFYGWWDWRFLFLIFFSTVIDYTVGLLLGKLQSQRIRKRLLMLSIVSNVGILMFFKYFNFFSENFITAFSYLGKDFSPITIIILLPIGISFYTFQTLSYTIDVYRKKTPPTSNFVVFATFVSFFPQLVIGPIERAYHMLPQLSSKREFNKDQSIIGIKQIIWGLFKKIVIADSCAQYVNAIFEHYNSASSLTLIIGAIYFTFQVYADFSGYSDMAIGTARLFGFNLMPNFKYPYFEKNIAGFWRHWHISLMSWFRDYVYIPLGGNRASISKVIRNIFIVFLLSGLWHGANWTFIIFGAYHGLLYAVYYLKKHFIKKTFFNSTNSVIEMFQRIHLFFWITLGMVIFRSPSLEVAYGYIIAMFQFNFSLEILEIGRYSFEMLPLILLFVFMEWFNQKKEFPICSNEYEYVKVSFLIALILFFGSFSNAQDFIYFKF